MICLYLYQYLLLWDILYIVVNGLMSTFQHKFNHVNLFSCSWNISRQSFYSYWWPDILVIFCCFYTFCICANSPRLELSSATQFVNIRLLVVKIQAKWSLWHMEIFKSICLWGIDLFVRDILSYKVEWVLDILRVQC